MFQLNLPGSFTIPDPVSSKFTTIGDVISAMLNFLFPITGLVLFGVLIIGGFELLTSGGNPEGIKKAQDKIVTAIIGFIIIFASFWIVQILQDILGLGKIF